MPTTTDPTVSAIHGAPKTGSTAVSGRGHQPVGFDGAATPSGASRNQLLRSRRTVMKARISTTQPTATIRTGHRHRGDAGRPSGNRAGSSRYPSSHGTIHQSWYQAANSANDESPARRSPKASSVYSNARPWVLTTTPSANSNQP